MLERLNGEDGLGAIFPGHGERLGGNDHSRVCRTTIRAATTAKRALQKLLVVGNSSAYCQPCVSPVWDTALAALGHAGSWGRNRIRRRNARLDWLQTEQVLDEPGDWQVESTRISRRRLGVPVCEPTTIPILTTRRWSPGPCTRRITRTTTPRA